MKILIVDDSLTAKIYTKKSIKMALPNTEVDYLQAANGQEAIDQLQGGPVDLIVSDVNMPVMDGIDFLKNIKDDSSLSKIPTIFVTSLANEARVTKLMGLGADGVISKPLKLPEFIEMLTKLSIVDIKPETAGGEEEDGWGS